ncbi:MAG: hypothetical protein CL532_00765 [Aestuariivita sp.]|nr:hypothetical protein [Aestuariivita sp.]
MTAKNITEGASVWGIIRYLKTIYGEITGVSLVPTASIAWSLRKNKKLKDPAEWYRHEAVGHLGIYSLIDVDSMVGSDRELKRNLEEWFFGKAEKKETTVDGKLVQVTVLGPGRRDARLEPLPKLFFSPEIQKRFSDFQSIRITGGSAAFNFKVILESHPRFDINEKKPKELRKLAEALHRYIVDPSNQGKGFVKPAEPNSDPCSPKPKADGEAENQQPKPSTASGEVESETTTENVIPSSVDESSLFFGFALAKNATRDQINCAIKNANVKVSLLDLLSIYLSEDFKAERKQYNNSAANQINNQLKDRLSVPEQSQTGPNPDTPPDKEEGTKGSVQPVELMIKLDDFRDCAFPKGSDADKFTKAAYVGFGGKHGARAVSGVTLKHSKNLKTLSKFLLGNRRTRGLGRVMRSAAGGTAVAAAHQAGSLDRDELIYGLGAVAGAFHPAITMLIASAAHAGTDKDGAIFKELLTLKGISRIPGSLLGLAACHVPYAFLGAAGGATAVAGASTTADIAKASASKLKGLPGGIKALGNKMSGIRSIPTKYNEWMYGRRGLQAALEENKPYWVVPWEVIDSRNAVKDRFSRGIWENINQKMTPNGLRNDLFRLTQADTTQYGTLGEKGQEIASMLLRKFRSQIAQAADSDRVIGITRNDVVVKRRPSLPEKEMNVADKVRELLQSGKLKDQDKLFREIYQVVHGTVDDSGYSFNFIRDLLNFRRVMRGKYKQFEQQAKTYEALANGEAVKSVQQLIKQGGDTSGETGLIFEFTRNTDGSGQIELVLRGIEVRRDLSGAKTPTFVIIDHINNVILKSPDGVDMVKKIAEGLNLGGELADLQRDADKVADLLTKLGLMGRSKRIIGLKQRWWQKTAKNRQDKVLDIFEGSVGEVKDSAEAKRAVDLIRGQLQRADLVAQKLQGLGFTGSEQEKITRILTDNMRMSMSLRSADDLRNVIHSELAQVLRLHAAKADLKIAWKADRKAGKPGLSRRAKRTAIRDRATEVDWSDPKWGELLSGPQKRTLEKYNEISNGIKDTAWDFLKGMETNLPELDNALESVDALVRAQVVGIRQFLDTASAVTVQQVKRPKGRSPKFWKGKTVEEQMGLRELHHTSLYDGFTQRLHTKLGNDIVEAGSETKFEGGSTLLRRVVFDFFGSPVVTKTSSFGLRQIANILDFTARQTPKYIPGAVLAGMAGKEHTPEFISGMVPDLAYELAEEWVKDPIRAFGKERLGMARIDLGGPLGEQASQWWSKLDESQRKLVFAVCVRGVINSLQGGNGAQKFLYTPDPGGEGDHVFLRGLFDSTNFSTFFSEMMRHSEFSSAVSKFVRGELKGGATELANRYGVAANKVPQYPRNADSRWPMKLFQIFGSHIFVVQENKFNELIGYVQFIVDKYGEGKPFYNQKDMTSPEHRGAFAKNVLDWVKLSSTAKKLQEILDPPQEINSKSANESKTRRIRTMNKKDIMKLITEAFTDKVYGQYPYSHREGDEEQPAEDYVEEWKMFCMSLIRDESREAAIELSKILIKDLELLEDVLDLAGQNQSLGSEIMRKMEEARSQKS